MKQSKTIKIYRITTKEFMDAFKLKGELDSINNYFGDEIEFKVVVTREKKIE